MKKLLTSLLLLSSLLISSCASGTDWVRGFAKGVKHHCVVMIPDEGIYNDYLSPGMQEAEFAIWETRWDICEKLYWKTLCHYVWETPKSYKDFKDNEIKECKKYQ
jgi:predicted small secreted protein